MKLTCGIATLIFLIFAALQFNDAEQYSNGDFWSWVMFYLGTSIISSLVGWGFCKSLPWVTGLAGFSLGSFVFRMQDEHGNFEFEKFGGNWFADETTGIMKQQTNEAGGLLIVAIWLFVLAYLLWRKNRKSTEC